MNTYLYGIMTFFIIISTAQAETPEYTKDLSLPQGAEVQVVSFDKKNQFVELISVKFPGEDVSWVKTSEFGKSIEIPKGQEVRVQHELNSGNEKHVGKKFILTKTVTTYVHQSAFKNKNKK